MLKVGDIAPAWKAANQDGKYMSSSEYAGKWLLLYFYPKDDTSGCTEEACGFRDAYASLSTRIAIVGVSADSVESHKNFSEKFSLPFTLIADPQHELIQAFGADGLLFPKRITFIIDPLNVIRKIYHGFDTKDHAVQISHDLNALQSDVHA